MKDTTVSVIIPSYNSISTIDETIAGIRRQTAIKSVLEIVIVDSSDDQITHEHLKSQEDGLIRVIRSGYRVMPAIQRNIGAKESKGDVLCFIDSDAFPHPDWIGNILDAYRRGYRIGGGSYQVPDQQRKSRVAYAQYFIEFSQFIGYGSEGKVSIVASCNIFCERELFMKDTGFPEIRASEDSLFCLKMGKYETLRYLPQAVVYHIFRENPGHFLSNQQMLGKYIFVFRRKSFDSFYYRGIFPYLLFPAFISFKFFRIFIRVLRTRKSHNLKYFFLSFPLMIKGLVAWSKGFLEGVREYKTGKHEILTAG
ncbi:MAG: glycosyltransferase family 2 protein [Bacteroidales bacterium]|nr:glycosyltransferase family 2 protein [Bacteroidales bacterium]